MEDAMIINKGAYDRGFGHGCVYKSYIRSLNEGVSDSGSRKSRFRMLNGNKNPLDARVDLKGLDNDGLPFIG